MISVLLKVESRFLVDKEVLKKRVSAFLLPRVRRAAQVSISIVGNRKMKTLNKHYRNIDSSTDVLSFPLNEIDPVDPRNVVHAQKFSVDHSSPDTTLRLGDVVVSYPEAVSEAARSNRMVDEVVEELIEHGILHLLGIHHD